MYVYTRSPSYTCRRCKNQIGAADMEEVFAGSLPDTPAGGEGQSQSLFALWPSLDRREKHRLLPLICAGITVPPEGAAGGEISITFITPGGAPAAPP